MRMLRRAVPLLLVLPVLGAVACEEAVQAPAAPGAEQAGELEADGAVVAPGPATSDRWKQTDVHGS